MFLFYILFLVIPLITAKSYGPSYRSSVMEGDKPILRMPAEQPETESDDDRKPPLVIRTADNAKMVRDLSLLIGWLVENFGYDLVPQGRRYKEELNTPSLEVQPADDAVDAPRDSQVDSLDEETDAADENTKSVLRERGGSGRNKNNRQKSSTSSQARKPSKQRGRLKRGQQSAAASNKLRGRMKQGTDKVSEGNLLTPVHLNWVTDLKEFIRDLITRFGQKDLEQYIKPVIQSVEKKHEVKITDIDVDQYGEILVTYVDRRKKKKPAPGPQALRLGIQDEEDEIADIQQQIRNFLNI